MSNTPLMPMATAVWLVENTTLTFKQIADFCNLHEVEIQGIADGEVAKGIKAYNPIISGQLTREEIELSSKDESRPLIIKSTDILFLDATFYDNSEINYRPIESIPHPFVSETIEYLKNLSLSDKKKIFFIHMNHTNPMLDPNSEIAKRVLSEGYNIAKIGQTFEL